MIYLEKKGREKDEKTELVNKRGKYCPYHSTPRGELADMLRRVVQTEAAANKEINFKIVESGGRTLKSILQRSNPTATVGCTDAGCVACRGGARGKGGNCRQSNVSYEIECGLVRGQIEVFIHIS